MRVLNKCFLLLVITSLAIVSGCSEDSPSRDTQPDNGGGVTEMQIDPDSGQ